MILQAVARHGLLLMFMVAAITSALTAQIPAQHPAVFTNSINAAAYLPVKKNYDEAAKSWYAVYKTGNIIHVYLAVTDPVQQRKIAMNGIELWIDPKGKKNKKTGILFPFAVQPKTGRPVTGPPPFFNGPGENSENHNLPDTNNIKALATIIASQREMKLTGFKDDLNGVQNIQHPSGIQVAVYFIKDTLVYDAQLPVNTLPEAVSLHSPISVCLIEKGMTEEIAMPGFGNNGMPAVADGDNMAPPAGPPPGREDRMRLFEDDTIWYKLLLPDTGIW